MNTPKEGYEIFTDLCYPKVGEVGISDFSLESVGDYIKTSVENITGLKEYKFFLGKDEEARLAQSLVGYFDRGDRDPLVVSTIQHNLIQIINSALLGILHSESIALSESAYFQAVDAVYQEKKIEEILFDFTSRISDSTYLRSYATRIPSYISSIFGAQECPHCFLGVTPKDELQKVIKNAVLAIIKTF